MADLVTALGGPPPRLATDSLLVERIDGGASLQRFHELRRAAFVDQQGLFTHHDTDDRDGDPRTIVLVAREPGGPVLGGVRLFPERPGADLAWWRGSRLVCDPGLGARRGAVGRALVRAACAVAEGEGALRFDALVQPVRERFFAGLGWRRVREAFEAGRPHVLMRHPLDRIADLVASTKGPIDALVGELRPGGRGWVGDDGAPVPGTDLVAATDAIVPAMVERDPEWAGWCAMLVCANDLAAMGATRLGAMDSVAAPDGSRAARIIAGVRRGSESFGLPVLGGHTQLGAPAALSVTGIGRAADPVPGGGGRPGHAVRLTADLEGRWRPGYRGTQWDSTSGRRTEEIGAMLDAVRRGRPRAAKDVSMAGLAGTLGMLAEASGCAAEIDVADVVRPHAAGLADWLTCFPGYAMVTADVMGTAPLPAGPAASEVCGRLVPGAGVTLVWPDGERIPVIDGPATGLGAAA